MAPLANATVRANAGRSGFEIGNGVIAFEAMGHLGRDKGGFGELPRGIFVRLAVFAAALKPFLWGKDSLVGRAEDRRDDKAFLSNIFWIHNGSSYSRYRGACRRLVIIPSHPEKFQILEPGHKIGSQLLGRLFGLRRRHFGHHFGRPPRLAMNELVFDITREADGGFAAEALGESIFTEGNTWDELRKNVLEAVKAFHFDRVAPQRIRLHLVRDETLAAS
jgi:hypothetical protein